MQLSTTTGFLGLKYRMQIPVEISKYVSNTKKRWIQWSVLLSTIIEDHRSDEYC